MPRRLGLFRLSLMTLGVALLSLYAATRDAASTAAAPPAPTQGSLQALDPQGKPRGLCPLKRTEVRAEISGFLSRVTVTQEFENPLQEKIEAVYVFPLPQAAAVDDMTLRVGERTTVRGRVLRREEAQEVYEAARKAGQVAGLLDQERPNIFTQSVANIMPGERVFVTISYVETLKYEEGSYEFSFPMVVGPRYIPAAAQQEGSTPQQASAPQEANKSSSATGVPDASRVTPPPAPPGTRAGHDISVEVALDAGVPLDGLKSGSHEIEMEREGATAARVRLKGGPVIPNKDFVLRYDVAGRRVEDALLAHRAPGDGRGGFFTLIVQPPERVTVEDVTPKELVFVLDTSGSMQGFPIEKAKETMKLALDGLYPQDTFNLITFSGDTHVLFPKPVPATRENLERAQKFLASRSGEGGTEMMKAIRAALAPSDSQAHVRVVCFMTDGHVGNDMEIIAEVQKHPNARVFAFGVGGSVNRFLLDQMAEHGRGEVEYVSLTDDGSAAARRFHRRVREPLLTDISVDWAGLPVADIYPRRVPDLFGAKPVVVTGRYTSGARGVVRLRGKMSGRDFAREINVVLPDEEPRRDVLATLWARRRVEDLTAQDYEGVQRGAARDDLRDAVTQLGIEYRLMTQFTSFVAVEEMFVNEGGQPRRIEVPVELPQGMSGQKETEGDPHGFGFQFFAGQRRVSSLHYLGGTTPTAQATSSDSTADATTGGTKAKTLPPLSRAGGTGGGSGSGVGPGRGGNTGGGTISASGGGAGGGGVDYSRPFNRAPEELKEQQPLSKLHPSLLAVVERLRKKEEAQPASEEEKFVREGRAALRIWLTDKSPETLAQLKQLGFEIVLDPQSSKLVIGRLPLDKLEALAALPFVRHVAPQK